jgi:hypothetical protein
MRSRDDLKRRAIQRAENTDKRIDYRVAGHCFFFDQGEVRCVGCGLADYAHWKGKHLYPESAQQIAKEHGDCGKPFDLKKRIAEIEAQYAPKPQKTKKGEEVTLETINAKLDRLMQALRIF